MNKFAFVLHPLDVSDVARKYPVARLLPDSWVEASLKLMKPRLVSHITGIKSLTGAEAQGYFIGCPLTPQQLLSDDPELAYRKIVAAGKIAEELGAQILGLGAYTSIAGDAGVTVAERLDIGVTTGNSYTCATAIEAALQAAGLLGYRLEECSAAVLGATGSIGRACSKLLVGKVANLVLAARRRERLEELARELRASGEVSVECVTDVNTALQTAQIVIAVTSAVEAVVMPEALRAGAVVCDVARPRDVSRRVAQERQDVLIIEGGAVQVPGTVDFGFDFGFPSGLAYACMAETMLLALEGRCEDYSLGRDLKLDQIRETSALAQKHGFKLAGFRSFERMVTDEQIARVRQAAEAARAGAA